MRRAWLASALALSALAAAADAAVPPKAGGPVQWVWFPEGEPAQTAPAGTRYFRKTFDVPKPCDEAFLDIAADNRYTVYVNGTKVGSGEDWKNVRRFDVTKLLAAGPNVIAVEAGNEGGPAGLLVRAGYVPNGASRVGLASDDTWKAAKESADGWTKPGFDDSKWVAAKVLGPASGTGPWKNLVWEAGGDDRFSVPAGFRVESVYRKPDPNDPFSLINMCFDAKGRLFVSQERGPILLCGDPDTKGVFRKFTPYCTQVKSSQGMCWIDGALYLVGMGPEGTGLYRVRDTNGDDQADEVKTLHLYKGGIGEHGPHAVVHGPDDMLYLVIGNHAWAKPTKLAANSPLQRWPDGQMGPDQGKPDTNEDVVLPRLNDARGHAANILAPGGTIWRCDKNGQNLAQVAAGFRNHYDAAFSPAGEMFTFDSDMEWDEGLPWYRAVRVCHCTPGADFVWRTGAANTPGYYIDSLPPTAETGRGSPVGVEFYDHVAFPAKYRGTFFMADWSIGVIWGVHLKRTGGTYAAEVERFCSGSAMNVTDTVVGPDGALYFTLGGRGTQGGIYRIVADGPTEPAPPLAAAIPQPLSAWGRAAARGALGKLTTKPADVLKDARQPAAERVRALDLLYAYGPKPEGAALAELAKDASPDVRAQAVYYLGVTRPKEAKETLPAALADADALVRRRACEALIRAGVEPSPSQLRPLLAEDDRFVRTAARLALQRINPALWATTLINDPSDRVAFEAVVALAKTHQLQPQAEAVFSRLRGNQRANAAPQQLLDYLRTVQLALVHAERRPIWVSAIGEQCFKLFPHADARVNRELAIVLTQLRREGQTTQPVHEKLLTALYDPKSDRQQQIHYFYCMRFLKEGWTPRQKAALLAWFDGTKTWSGGHSFAPFLENILRDVNDVFTPEDRAAALAKASEQPWAAAALLRLASPQQLPSAEALVGLYKQLMKASGTGKGSEMREGLVEALTKLGPPARTALREVGTLDAGQRIAVGRALAKFGPATADDVPHLLRGLEAVPPPLYALEMIAALKKSSVKPKPDDPLPVRAVLLASGRLQSEQRWKAVELLRHWTGKEFGADKGEWKPELAAWTKWYGQTFPKEPALPDAAVTGGAADARYKFEELLALVAGPSASKGDAAKGRLAFAKANCLKCHKYGSEGEGIGPELTTLSKRFQRKDTLEAIYFPSKVISDQYRSSMVVTSAGQQVIGLVGEQGDTLTITLQDATKVTLKKSEVESRFASLVSVMPEKLLDGLTKDEIVDLFAFLESEPAAAKPATGGGK
jgi:putative heme-binding domain-containing protein